MMCPFYLKEYLLRQELRTHLASNICEAKSLEYNELEEDSDDNYGVENDDSSHKSF